MGRTILIVTCLIGVLSMPVLAVACGPRPLTKEEKAAQAAQDKRDKVEAKAQEAQAKAAAAEKRADVKVAEARERKAKAREKAEEKRAKYYEAQIKKRPLPRGVQQVTSRTFLVERRFAGSARFLCSGPVIDHDGEPNKNKPNDAESLRQFDDATLRVACREPVRKYRDQGFKP